MKQTIQEPVTISDGRSGTCPDIEVRVRAEAVTVAITFAP